MVQCVRALAAQESGTEFKPLELMIGIKTWLLEQCAEGSNQDISMACIETEKEMKGTLIRKEGTKLCQ